MSPAGGRGRTGEDFPVESPGPGGIAALNFKSAAAHCLPADRARELILQSRARGHYHDNAPAIGVAADKSR